MTLYKDKIYKNVDRFLQIQKHSIDRSIDRSIYIIHNNKNGVKGSKRVQKVKYGQKRSKGQIWSKRSKRVKRIKKGQKGSKGSTRVHPGSTPDQGPGQKVKRSKLWIHPRIHPRVHPRVHPGSGSGSKGQKVKFSILKKK